MKRLRHPIRAIREPFGTAGLIIACVALIAALGGTALAAAKLNSTQKKEVEKIAKKVSKPGPAGATGPAGPAGAKGDNGAAGANGTNGTAGKDGEGVTISAASTGECPEGGSKFTNASGSGKACNGEEGGQGPRGPEGKEGSPWTLGGTLPPGATETGAWSVNGTEADSEGLSAPISFPIPLPFVLAPSNSHFVSQESQECRDQFPDPDQAQELTDCEGKVEANCPSVGTELNPDAALGQLCIYGGLSVIDTPASTPTTTFIRINRPIEGESLGAGRSGARILLGPPTGVVSASGTFAVTSCTKTAQVPPDPTVECPGT